MNSVEVNDELVAKAESTDYKKRKQDYVLPHDDTSMASSDSGTGRLNIIEGLRKHESKINKYKRENADLQKRMINILEKQQVFQQQLRIQEELLKNRKEQIEILDKAIVSSLRFLSECTTRNVTAVAKQVINVLTEGRLRSQRMKLDLLDETNSAKNSSFLASVIFGTSFGRPTEKEHDYEMESQEQSASLIRECNSETSQSLKLPLSKKLGPVTFSSDMMATTDLDPRHRGPITSKKHN